MLQSSNKWVLFVRLGNAGTVILSTLLSFTNIRPGSFRRRKLLPAKTHMELRLLPFVICQIQVLPCSYFECGTCLSLIWTWLEVNKSVAKSKDFLFCIVCSFQGLKFEPESASVLVLPLITPCTESVELCCLHHTSCLNSA